jgi:hypothetical protein
MSCWELVYVLLGVSVCFLLGVSVCLVALTPNKTYTNSQQDIH